MEMTPLGKISETVLPKPASDSLPTDHLLLNIHPVYETLHHGVGVKPSFQ